MGFLDKIKKGVGNATGKAKSAAQRAREAAEKAKREAQEKINKAKREAEDKVKKAQREAQDKAQAVQEKIKETIAKIKVPLKDIPFIQLMPLKPLMKDALRARGVPHTDSISDIATKFVQYVVDEKTKKAPYINQLSGGSTVLNNTGKPVMMMGNAGKLINKNHFHAEEETQYTESGSTASQYEAGAKQTKGIIEKIIAWFKERKAKKQAKKDAEAQAAAMGEAIPINYGDPTTPPLTDEEEKLINGADAIAKEIVTEAEKEADKEDMAFSTTEIILSVLGICIVIYGVKKIFFK